MPDWLHGLRFRLGSAVMLFSLMYCYDTRELSGATCMSFLVSGGFAKEFA